jgi:hypothetical protein
MMLPMLGRALNLTDAQRDQVKAIVQAHGDEWKTLGDRARTAHQALQAAVTSGTVDEGLIRQRATEVGAVEADIAVARARAQKPWHRERHWCSPPKTGQEPAAGKEPVIYRQESDPYYFPLLPLPPACLANTPLTRG